MIQKISKLEEDLAEQKGREKEPKSLQGDEAKYIVDMVGWELNLNGSKIRELEDVNQCL